MTTPSVPRIGFVLEQSLGHVTHAANLRRVLPMEPSIRAELLDVAYDVDGLGARVPLFNSNWTVRAGVRARRGIGRMQRREPLDALLIHTQVPAVLCQRWMDRIPTVVSLDATPLQYDELGAHYGHQPGNERVERLKYRANRSCLHRAVHVVAWSEWTKRGVVDGYGVAPDKVTVIAPGVTPSLWTPPSLPTDTPPVPEGGPVRILFVGGDLARKGGDVLLRAFAALRGALADRPGAPEVELHLATGTSVPPTPGVTVHHGLKPNSAELISLYHRSHVFCLPTRGDCLPMVLSEAGAAGLASVSTAVAGIPEIVRHGETGLIVPVDDTVALTGALRTLVEDPALRLRLGGHARHLVAEHFDAEKNARRLVELPDVRQQVAQGTRPRPDYLEMAAVMGADLVDVDQARDASRPVGRLGLRLIERLGGRAALLAWYCFRNLSLYDVILTDGEHVGLPLALLCRLTFRRPFAHVMIVHILSVPKKAALFRWFRLGRFIDTMLVYASAQERFVVDELGFPAERVVLTTFMVDTEFFRPDAVPANPGRMICSAGLERRDYPTFIEAVRGLDVRVVVAAASPWSKQADSTTGADIPANVRVTRLGFVDLRQLYADARFVVMPLHDTEFQAGVTTILEAMAMGRAVVCSRTRGQTDVLDDGVTGLYVPPADVAGLRAAIQRLLDDPVEAERIGAQARAEVVRTADVTVYAQRLAAVVAQAAARHGR